MSLGLYLHIPYCFSKCRYCDFYSAPGKRGVPRAYVDAFCGSCTALHRTLPSGRTPSISAAAPQSAGPGGRGPAHGSRVSPARRRDHLGANPETVTEESLRAFREAGVNRISFGVQSARDSQLKTLGRPHTAKQARAAFRAAQRAGFENISGDIMLALPHYTQAEFDETLELIESGGATHISAYLLKIEPDSAFGKHPPEGLPPATKQRTSTSMPWSSWNTTATSSTRSRTSRNPAMRANTTSSTGTAAITSASARRPTPAWAASGSATPPTRKPSSTTTPHPSWMADAARRTI